MFFRKKGIKRLFKGVLSMLLVISWILISWPPFWQNPRFPKEIEEVKAAVPAGVIVAWTGTELSIPSGWSRVAGLDSKYPKGTADATDPGGTGGALTHSHTTQSHTHTGDHTHTVPNGPAGSGSTARDTGTSYAPVTHTHISNPSTTNPTVSLTGDTPSTDAVNNEPPYYNVIFIQSNGTPTGIPNGAIALWSDGAGGPTGWNLADGVSGRPDLRNSFMKGAATGSGGGAGSGATTHTHTIASHTHGTNFSHDHPTVTSSGPSGTMTGGIISGSKAGAATSTHSHTLTIGSQATDAITGNTDTAQAGDNLPPYKSEAFMQNNNGVDDLPVGIIAMWTGLLANIPSGWSLADGTNSTPDLRSQFVRGANTLGSIGGTGGSLTHTHTATGHTHAVASHSHTVTAAADGAGDANATAGSTNVSTTAHTHPSWSNTGASSFTSGSGTPTVDNYTDTQPPYYAVAYIMYKGIPVTYTQNRYRFYVDNDLTNPTDAWSSITDINIAENAGVTILPAKYDPPSSTQELRLRVNLTIGGNTLSASTQKFKLQYKKGTDASCTSGSWSDVLNNGTTGSDWEYASATVTDGANITGVLSDTTSLKGEQYARSKPTALNNAGAAIGEKIEYDFHIVGGTTWADAAQYSFRVVKTTDGSDTTELTTYSTCPTLVTEPGVSRLMRHGEFLIETATESGFFWAD